MEENKLGVAMLLSGIATVVFWVFYTSFFNVHTTDEFLISIVWLDDVSCSCLCAVNGTSSIKTRQR